MLGVVMTIECPHCCREFEADARVTLVGYEDYEVALMGVRK